MKTNMLILFLGIFFTISSLSFCQPVENNLQQRLATSIRYKANKKLNFFINQEIRTKNNTFSVNEYLVECKLNYEITNWLEFGGRYRFRSQESNKLQRYGFETSISKTYGQFKPSIRLMFSEENNIKTDDKFEKLWRTRFKVKYKFIKNISLYIGIEPFREIDNGDWEKIRYLFGTNYRINKNVQLDLQYKLDYFLLKFQNDHILNLKFRINL